MSSRKAEERNEKVIRGLLKLPPNRKCINCNGMAPQYVCTNFWTFICIACSGIHREYTHRVKSISMAKFTKEEVEALQRGGNQRARELFLKEWDMQRMRLPDSSNPDKIREFIKSVYVDKKFAGGESFEKPPRDLQNLRYYEDHRRASSYHSFSQSPPYEHQYEERRYGKQSGTLFRRPGSDHGLSEGNISSFMYSPGRLRDQMSEDRFANESTSSSRISDLSVYSAGDPSKFDFQSPNFHEAGYSSPSSRQVRDILIQDGRSQSLNVNCNPSIKEESNGRPLSLQVRPSGSFGSFDSNSVSLKSVNSGSLADFLESEFPSKMHQLEASIPSNSSHSSQFSVPSVQPQVAFAPSIDLFANFHQSSSTSSPDLMGSVQQPVVSSIPPSSSHSSQLNVPSVQSPVTFAPSIDLFANSHQSSLTSSPKLMDNVQQPVHHVPPSSSRSSQFNVPSSVQPPVTFAPSIDLFANSHQSSSTPSPELIGSVHQPVASILPTSVQSSSSHFAKHDLFNVSSVQQPLTPTPSSKNMTASLSANEGWATFDLPQNFGGDVYEANTKKIALHSKIARNNESTVASLHSINNVQFPVQSRESVGSPLYVADQQHVDILEARKTSDPREAKLLGSFEDLFPGGCPDSSFGALPLNDGYLDLGHKQPESCDKATFNSQSRGAFDALPSGGGIPLSSFGFFPLNNEYQGLDHEQPDSRAKAVFNVQEGMGIMQPESTENAALIPIFIKKIQELSINPDELKKYPQDAKVPDFNISLNLNGMGSSQFHSSMLTLPDMVGNAEDHKSKNPFDFPFESVVDTNNVFLDIGSLGAELPNPQISSSFFNDDLSEQWFPRNSVSPYMSPVHQGLAYMGGQMPSSHLPNVPSQGHVSLGGNPFA